MLIAACTRGGAAGTHSESVAHETRHCCITCAHLQLRPGAGEGGLLPEGVKLPVAAVATACHTQHLRHMQANIGFAALISLHTEQVHKGGLWQQCVRLCRAGQSKVAWSEIGGRTDACTAPGRLGGG